MFRGGAAAGAQGDEIGSGRQATLIANDIVP
jgi:hypothetical protein